MPHSQTLHYLLVKNLDSPPPAKKRKDNNDNKSPGGCDGGGVSNDRLDDLVGCAGLSLCSD